MELDNLRTIFPNWPSELDIAKGASNWTMLAQQFFFAASVLYEEGLKARKEMHSNKKLILTENEDIFKRAIILTPTLFCAAFALELAAKAALIRQNKGVGIESGKKLPFNGNGHGVSALCEQLHNLHLSASEQHYLKQIDNIIANGKYPTGLKPSDSQFGFDAPNISDFMKVVNPIYEKLMNHHTP